jgi:predicted thioesterase
VEEPRKTLYFEAATMPASGAWAEKRPSPLHVTLRFEAGLDKVEGRKIYASGRMLSGETVTAEAEGLFISVDAERFRALVQEARARE